MNRIPLQLIKDFYHIGRSEDFEALHKLPKEVIENYSHIMRETPDAWREISGRINTEDMACLMKTLTVAEKELPGWKAGSVSPVIWLGMILCQRGYKDINALREWIEKHSDNEWLTKRW